MTLTDKEAQQLGPLKLAYIGDAVFELRIREKALVSGRNMQALHRMTTSFVCAPAQAKALTAIMEKLTEDELALVKRGRNAHARHAAPKSASCAEYAASTGFETLIGYLHLTGQTGRIEELVNVIQEHLNK